MFVIHFFFFFYCNVLRKNLLSLLLCLFKKSDSLYLFRTKSLLLIVIDKVTIIESGPFSLVAKGAFVTFGKICLCVKSHSFIFSLIPRCPLSLNAQFLLYLRLWLWALWQIRWICAFEISTKFYFVNVISVLQLISKKIYTY